MKTYCTVSNFKWVVFIFGMGFLNKAIARESFYLNNVNLKGVTTTYKILKPSLDVGAFAANTKLHEITYKPSTEGKMSVSVDYKNIGLTAAASTPRSSEFRSQYGEGQATDFQFRYGYENYYIESYYQQYKGYYIENPSSVMTNSGSPHDPFPGNEDMKVEHYGVVVFKFLNPDRFNPKWALELTQKPKDDGGTWYYVFGFNTHRLETPVSLVPKTAIGDYKKLADLRQANAITLSAGGGGAYAWVFRRKWILSGIFGASLGAQNLKTEYTSGSKDKMNSAIKAHVKAVGGYSGEQFLTGISIQTDSTMLNDRDSELALRSTEAAVFAGWRF